MNSLNTIFDANFDANIATKPDFFDGQVRSINTVRRGVVSMLLLTNDEILGVIDRRYYDRESHDGYICWAKSTTEADAINMVKALKKVCATYAGSSDENILQWEEGDWEIFTNAQYVYRFNVIVRKAGMVAYD